MIKISTHDGALKEALDAFKEAHYPAADLEHYGASQPNFRKLTWTLVARDGEDIAGFLLLVIDTDVAIIDEFLVHTDKRRQGVGMSLLRSAEEKAREQGCHVVKLETGADWKARQFYEKHGYVLRAELNRYYGGRDFVLMDKIL
jgi:GNAT superfamily N-acetyltransferase